MKLLCLTLLASMFVQADAWGFVGHRVVGMIAESFLNPAVSEQMKALNISSLWKRTNEFPHGMICFPDPYAHTADGAWSASLHYVYSNKFPWMVYGCDCVAPCVGPALSKGYCSQGDSMTNCCVISGIQKYYAEAFLEMRGEHPPPSSGVVPLWLKLVMLSHFTGDIHEPMHMNFHNDVGGNTFPVRFFGNDTCNADGFSSPCNLHIVFDSMIINKALSDRYGPQDTSQTNDPREMKFMLDILKYCTNCHDAWGPPLVPEDWYARDIIVWGQSSLAASSMAYLIPHNFDVDQHYVDSAMPLIARELYRAGWHLSVLLNSIFDLTRVCKQCFYGPPLCHVNKSYVRPAECDVGDGIFTPPNFWKL